MLSGAARPLSEPDWLGLFTLLAGDRLSLNAIQLQAEITGQAGKPIFSQVKLWLGLTLELA